MNTSRRSAFTLLELLLASAAAALILISVYSVFVHAIHLRDNATRRVHNLRLRARAERAIRDDLNNALISGGVLASSLSGGASSSGSPAGAAFPGYLKLTTTTGRDTGAIPYGEVQQVEYYIVRDPNAGIQGTGGTLVRAVTRDLLSGALATATATAPKEEPILGGVQSMQVEFYDGANWQDSWEFDSDAELAANAASASGVPSTIISTGNTTLPSAIRVDVQPVAASANGNLPPPIEILVPWPTQPFTAATPAPDSTGSASATPTPTPTPTPPPTPPPRGDRPPGGDDPGQPPPGGGDGGPPPRR